MNKRIIKNVETFNASWDNVIDMIKWGIGPVTDNWASNLEDHLSPFLEVTKISFKENSNPLNTDDVNRNVNISLDLWSEAKSLMKFLYRLRNCQSSNEVFSWTNTGVAISK